MFVFFFFFQAEDGIRDHCVTGVQTCALPISVQPQLDVVGGARKGRVIPFLLVLFGLIIPSVPGFAQDHGPEEARLAAARKAFDGARWDEAARLAEGPSDQSSQLDLLLGLALSRMERWGQAKTAFQVGAKKSPRDARFPVELAGIAYKQKDFCLAKKDLDTALRLNAHDQYTQEFLASIYFLEGN